MTMTLFQHLCDGVCDRLAAPRFEVGDSIEGAVAFHLVRGGVTINMLYFPHTCADHAFVLFEFGPIPQDDPRAPDMMQALLDANFLVPEPHPPALGRNPVTGDIVLRCVYPLAAATPDGLMQLFDRGVAMAHEWRQGRFLADPTPRASLDRVAPGSLA